jgi:hypothetical protein
VAFVATEMRRITVSGAGVREMVRDGRGNSRGGIGMREGRRGADEGDLGSSGRVIEGTGLGEGIDLKESASEVLGNLKGTEGFRFKLDCDSAKSRDRKDLYSG